MKDLDLLDGDVQFDGGDLVFVEGADEVRQRVLLRLRRQLGEWPYNLAIGVDWLNQILAQPNPNLAVFRAIILREIAETDGVLAVRTLDLELTPDRVLTFSWAALVDAGNGTVDEFVDSAAAVFDEGEMQFLLEPLGQI